MRKEYFILLLLIVYVSCATYTVIDTPLGGVRGVIEDGVRKFRSIPYGKAPVGNLRWTAPEPYPGILF